MIDLDKYKLKTADDVVKFIDFDALDYEENKDFLVELSNDNRGWGGNIFEYLNLDIVLYPRYGTFVLKAKNKGVGKQLKALLQNEFDDLRTLHVNLQQIRHIEEIAKLFNLDLEIKRERICGRYVYRAYICGKGVK
jgi:hypothetical protein